MQPTLWDLERDLGRFLFAERVGEVTALRVPSQALILKYSALPPRRARRRM